MNEIAQNKTVENLIYEINGIEVMFDSDLARLYNVETKRINEAVKNNPDKFPERFLFRISDEEYSALKSKFSTSKGGSRKGHTAFTEQGVYMLATILKSKEATQVSIRIMDAFVKIRHYINYNKNFLPNKILLLEDKVDNNTKRIDELFDKFDSSEIAKNHIFFEGQLYDAYSLIMDILNKAKKEIIIIDNYAGKELLDELRNIDVSIKIVSKNIDNALKKKYESQYNNVKFINNNSFHDRFIIIDQNKLYTIGSSLKDIGKKCFVINEFKDKEYLAKILDIVDKSAY